MVQGGDIECSIIPLGTADCSPGTGGYSAFWYGQGIEGDHTTWTMPDEFDPILTAEGWQLSNAPIYPVVDKKDDIIKRGYRDYSKVYKNIKEVFDRSVN